MRPERAAVSALFLVNGFLIGSWAPKIPVIMARLEIGESMMGVLILVFGLGSISMMPVCGALTARNGSAPILRVTAFAVLPTLLLLTLAPDLITTAMAAFLFGGLAGGMDVAMNANAVAVEKQLRKAIMSSCHGFWSLGGLIGAAIGGLLLGTAGELAHAVVLTVIAGAAVIAATPFIINDRPHPEERAAIRLSFPRTPLPYLVGAMALFSMIPEGTILDWGALYLQKDLGASIQLAALGFAAFSGTMATMRFLGDAIRQKLGAVTTIRVCGVIAFAGLLIAAFAQTPFVAIAGFAIAGIGISNLVPIAFSAAGNLPGVPPGIGLSIVTVTGYAGILVAPSAIGFAAEHVGFPPVFMSITVLIAIVVCFSRLARHADFSSDHPGET